MMQTVAKWLEMPCPFPMTLCSGRGVQAGGAPLPAGLYRFEVEATDLAGNALPTTQAETYARIVEVQTLGIEPRVVFDGGAEAPASSVTALREPV